MLKQAQTISFEYFPPEILELIILYCIRTKDHGFTGKHVPQYPEFRDCIRFLSTNKFLYNQVFYLPDLQLFRKVRINSKNFSILKHLRFRKFRFSFKEAKINYDLFTKIFSEYPPDFVKAIHLKISNIPQRNLLSVFNEKQFEKFCIEITQPVPNLKIQIGLSTKHLKISKQFQNVCLKFDKHKTFETVTLFHTNEEESSNIVIKNANIDKLIFRHFLIRGENIKFLDSNIRSIVFNKFLVSRKTDFRFLIKIPDTAEISFINPSSEKIYFSRDFVHNKVNFDFRFIDVELLFFESIVNIQNFIIHSPSSGLRLEFRNPKSLINTLTLKNSLNPFYLVDQNFTLSFEVLHKNNRIENLELFTTKQKFYVSSNKNVLLIHDLIVYFMYCRKNPERKFEIYLSGVKVENLKVYIYSKSITFVCTGDKSQSLNKTTVFFKDPYSSQSDEKYQELNIGDLNKEDLIRGKTSEEGMYGQNSVILRELKCELSVTCEYDKFVDIQSN
jgi:hypothetical protein